MDDIRAELEAMAEPDYRDFTSALLPGVDDVLGVRLPKIRALAKKIAAGDFRAYIAKASDASFEERMLRGMVIGAARCGWEERAGYILDFLPHIGDWSVCDSFVTSLRCIPENREQALKLITPLTGSEKEFTVRFAAVVLQRYYADEEYFDTSMELLRSIKHEGYYVKMAVAWALSSLYLAQPERAEKYFASGCFDDFTQKKAYSKIADSRMIADSLRREFRARASAIRIKKTEVL